MKGGFAPRANGATYESAMPPRFAGSANPATDRRRAAAPRELIRRGVRLEG
jgi:hypothetical protein